MSFKVEFLNEIFVIIEEEDDDEHRMFQMKRIMAKIDHENFILLKGIFNHIAR
jgi:hypothetical protein